MTWRWFYPHSELQVQSSNRSGGPTVQKAPTKRQLPAVKRWPSRWQLRSERGNERGEPGEEAGTKARCSCSPIASPATNIVRYPSCPSLTLHKNHIKQFYTRWVLLFHTYEHGSANTLTICMELEQKTGPVEASDEHQVLPPGLSGSLESGLP